MLVLAYAFRCYPAAYYDIAMQVNNQTLVCEKALLFHHKRLMLLDFPVYGHG